MLVSVAWRRNKHSCCKVFYGIDFSSLLFPWYFGIDALIPRRWVSEFPCKTFKSRLKASVCAKGGQVCPPITFVRDWNKSYKTTWVLPVTILACISLGNIILTKIFWRYLHLTIFWLKLTKNKWHYPGFWDYIYDKGENIARIVKAALHKLSGKSSLNVCLKKALWSIMEIIRYRIGIEL